MEDKKKKFIVPEVEIVTFTNDDIITGSNDSNWEGDDNMEGWL